MKHLCEEKRERAVLFVCALIQAVIYIATFSRIPASDGFRYVSDIDKRNWDFMLLPNHFSPQAVMIFVQKTLSIISIRIPTLTFMQWFNVGLAIWCFVLFYKIVRTLNISQFLSLVSALTFAYSYGLWHFANGEIHHLGVLATLAICYLLRCFQMAPTRSLVVWIAILHVAAMTFHESHVLMGAPIVWILVAHPSIRSTKSYLLTYLIICGILTVCVFGALAYFYYGVRSVHDFFAWLFVYHSQTKGYILLQKQNLPWIRLLKGAFMSFDYGTQILVDSSRHLIGELKLSTYLYLMLTTANLALYGVAVLILGLSFEQIPKDIRVFAGGLVIWILTYKLLLNFRFAPESPEYHLSSLAPMLLLIPISLSRLRKTVVAGVLVVSIFLTMFSVNLFAGILPQFHYGKMIDQFEKFSSSYFKPNDFFVSSESGLDFLIESRWDHRALKDIFLKTPKEKSFPMIAAEIQKAFKDGKRVFVYNLVPGGYAVRGISHYNPDGHYTDEDFQNFERDLFGKYHAKPIYKYWESDSSQYYLFDNLKNTVWQLNKE